MRPCRRVVACLPFRTAPDVMLLAVLGLLFAAATVHAQGPGLYKDGRRILDLEQMVGEDPGIAKTLAEPATPARELYRRVLGDEAGTAQRPFDAYFRLAAACRQAVRYSKARPDELEKAISTLVDLEPALATAHAGVIDHLETIRRSLAAEPRLAGKISRLESLEGKHLPLAEELLALLAALRDAEEGGHVFARDAALRDLVLYFEADPIKAVEPEVDNGFRTTSMPVVRPRENATPLTAGSLLSAYPVATAKSAMADPADLAPTIDVQITPEIMALADSLDRSPVAIYYFVRDQFEFEPYLGSRKGSQQTLQHGKGNDYDQASLLIALLRAAGIPARYAAGEAYMPMDRVLNWPGFTSSSGAASLLATAGMDPTWYPGGISCQRVWVEAYIPFANYRGAVNDSTGRMWIPMDPAFRQHDITWGHNLPADMGFDAETFVDDYMSTFRPETPIEHFIARLQSELPAYHAGATLADLVDRREVVLEPDGILPGTLPYELIAFDGTFSEIPSNMRYGIRFHVYGGGTDLDYTTTLPEIVLKQVTISYVGATPADQALIDAAGGVFGVTSPYLVDVVPVLKIDGCEVDRGTGQVMMGTTHNSDMHFTVPTGASNVVPTVTNYITAGNYQGIGIDTQDAFPATFETPSTSCPEELLGQELHQTALTYLNNVDTYEDLAAGYLHMTVLNDVSEAIVENAVTVYFSGSLPVSFTWTGMIVDADRKIVGPFATDGRLDACQEMRLTGADGSFQENRVFETRFEEEAISAVKILSLAADSLITVCRITSSIAADCPGLSQPSSVVSAINAALAQGREVTIPERPFTYFDWSGTAWIAMDPATCAAGYIISGGQNGGATVQEWVIWYPGLHCLQPIGDITLSPSAEDDYYLAESGAVWTFTVPNLVYWSRDDQGTCIELLQGPKDFQLNYTVAELAQIFGAGEYTFTAGSNVSDCNCEVKQKKATIVKVAIETPHGNPRTTAGANNTNERVFSASLPGVLTVECKAKIEPATAAGFMENRIRWTIDDSWSALTWDTSWPGASVKGKGATCEATFTGLPTSNSSFGVKAVQLEILMDVTNIDKTESTNIEVFYPRDTTNNPGGADPNWFYYWRQVYMNASVRYDSSYNGSAHAPGMTGWSYAIAPDKTSVVIGNSHPGRFSSYTSGNVYSGIDRYAATVAHEEEHIRQIALADPLAPTSGSDSFRHGWSLNQPIHNHWTRGPDLKWGRAGVDDDGNGTVDDAKALPPFEPGNHDDVSLQHATYRDWPASWPLPSPNSEFHPIESAAVNVSNGAVTEHDHSASDWGSPGKQHRTINKWDD